MLTTAQSNAVAPVITPKNTPPAERTIPINIWEAFDRLHAEITKRAFNHFQNLGIVTGTELSEWLASEREFFHAPLNQEVTETENETEFMVSLYVPNFTPESLNLYVDDSHLTIRGTTVPKPETTPGPYTESVTSEFCRVFTFPTEIVPEEVKAKYENGMLQIVLPKTTKSLRIPITTF
ncbi:MAG TPA: Hsp20/alpha crystallin family protein [Terriglobales bacterium]|jgi:HSP20 family protein